MAENEEAFLRLNTEVAESVMKVDRNMFVNIIAALKGAHGPSTLAKGGSLSSEAGGS